MVYFTLLKNISFYIQSWNKYFAIFRKIWRYLCRSFPLVKKWGDTYLYPPELPPMCTYIFQSYFRKFSNQIITKFTSSLKLQGQTASCFKLCPFFVPGQQLNKWLTYYLPVWWSNKIFTYTIFLGIFACLNNWPYTFQVYLVNSGLTS